MIAQFATADDDDDTCPIEPETQSINKEEKEVNSNSNSDEENKQDENKVQKSSNPKQIAKDVEDEQDLQKKDENHSPSPKQNSKDENKQQLNDDCEKEEIKHDVQQLAQTQLKEIDAPLKEKDDPVIIKGTQRSDGSWRKDVKIRPGFMNKEMIQRYTIPQKRNKK